MKIKSQGDISQEQAVISFIEGAFNYSPQGSRAVAVFIMNGLWAYCCQIIDSKPETLKNTPGGGVAYRSIALQLRDAMKRFIDTPIIQQPKPEPSFNSMLGDGDVKN